MWDLFQGCRLFFGLKNGVVDDEQHLAEMVALLGPPPKSFLERSEACKKYWDSEGMLSPEPSMSSIHRFYSRPSSSVISKFSEPN